MWKLNRLLVLIASLTTATTVHASSQEAQLLEVLNSDATLREKSDACRQLARIATKESVPTLSALLKDDKLAHMARYALEPIPDPSVDQALRDALGQVSGRVKLGVIGSLGARRDAQAVDALAELLRQEAVAQAAARALGNIGVLEAAEALEAALPGKSGAVQLAVCEGLLRCAEALAARDQTEPSQAIYDRLRLSSALPTQVRAAALRGAILAREEQGAALLVEAMQDDDYALAAAAARTAMESPHAEIAEALTAQLPSLSADRRTLLILALTAKGETRILPVVMQSVQGGDQQMRILALRALKRIGDASCVDPLVDAASEESKEVAAAALETLESLQDAAVDGRLAASLDGAEGKRRLVLIELADRRRMSVAAPALWRAASDADPAVRAAAFAALGSIIDTNDLPKLLDRLPATTHDEEAAALDQALRAVSQRSEDRDVVAAQFAAALDTVDVNVKSRILESLSALGGPAALETVGAAARSNDEPLRDAATRVLGRWKSADVAPLLVDLHETVDDNRTKIRAIRAYIRVARQFDMPADERAAMCRTALRIAERYEDRRLVLEVLLRYPDEKMLSIAQEAAKIPDLRDEATLVAMAMNSKGVDRAELGRALAEAGHKPVDLEIIKAEYGAGEQKKDVTALLRKYAKSYRIIFLPSTSYNASFDGDPAEGAAKQLEIKYRIDGQAGDVTLSENDPVVLPTPK